MNKVYILIGPPGAGKGTQADFLSKKFNLNIFSPGNYLRNEAKKRSKLGLQINDALKKGILVDDKIVNDKVKEIITKTRKDLLFDGYPRTKFQAEFLDKLLKENKIRASVIEIKVTDKVIMDRITGRRSCSCGESFHIEYKKPKKPGICDKCGKRLFIRNDSRPEVVAQRIQVYKKQTKPLINFYQKNNYYRFVQIDGSKMLDEVKDELLKKVK